MKKRIFMNMCDAVYRVSVFTEDWSEGDIGLMRQYGEPEVDAGGTIEYLFGGETKSVEFGSDLVRLVHGFPYSKGFDSRDYEGGCAEAIAAGNAWKDKMVERIDEAIVSLRANKSPLPTEEVIDNI